MVTRDLRPPFCPPLVEAHRVGDLLRARGILRRARGSIRVVLEAEIRAVLEEGIRGPPVTLLIDIFSRRNVSSSDPWL